MKSTITALSIIAIIFVSTLRLEATVYLVSNLQEFNSAVQVVVPGDSVVLKKGTWSNIIFYFTANGAPGNPITLTVEEDGTTVITGNSSLRIFGDYLFVDGLYFKDGR